MTDSNAHLETVRSVRLRPDGGSVHDTTIPLPAGPAQPVSGDQFAGYHHPREIARGGMGAILSALDPATQREVAIKVMQSRTGATPDQLQAFVVEGQVTAQLEHPNIVPIYALGRTAQGELYLTMKLVRGQSLEDLLRDERPARSRLLRIFEKVCDAMAFAHARGVIHRDLKPANIMLGEFGEVLVMDWGLAKMVGLDVRGEGLRTSSQLVPGAETAQTVDGDIKGTPAYMPPEQAEGDLARIDTRSDVYSLGAVLYEMLTGSPPFTARSLFELLDAVVEGRLVPPRERDASVPAELEAIVLRAMAADPEARYASVLDLQADVEAYLAGHLVSAASYRPLAVALKWARRNTLAVGVAAAVCLTAAALGGWRWTQHRARLDGLRAAVAEAPGGKLVTRSATLLAAAPPAARRRPPTPHDRRRLAAALKTLVERADRQRALEGAGDRDVRPALHRTLVAVSRLAELGEDFALASMALDEAAGLAVDDDEVARRRAAIEVARGARQQAQLAAVADRLADARAGRLDGDDAYRAALVELSSYRGAHTVDALVRELDAHTTALEDVAERLLREAGAPREDMPDEQPIAGAARAARAWRASQAALDRALAEPAAPGAADRAALAAIRERLAARVLRIERIVNTPDDALARCLRQVQRAVAPERPLQLICEVLGHLGDDRAARPLARYLRAEHDPRRAAWAGIALLRLNDPLSLPAVRELVGLRSGQRRAARWPVRGLFWQRLRPHLRDVGGGSGSAEGDDWERARRRIAEGDDAGARTLLDALIADGPDARALAARSELHGRAGRTDAALEDARRAVAADGRSAAAHRALGRALLLHGKARADEAIAALTRACELAPGSVEALLARARALQLAGRLEPALADAEAALRLRPEDLAALVRRGETLAALRRYDRALSDFEQVLRRRGDDVEALLGIADVRLLLLQPDAALPHARKALGLRPDSERARRLVGHALMRVGRFSEARTLIARGSDGRTLPLGLALDLAELELRANNAHRTMAIVDGVLAEAPDNALARMLRGASLTIAGRFAEARADLDRAIARSPGLRAAYVHRAQLRRRTGDHAGAVADFDRAIREVDDPDARVGRARARLELGQRDEAAADLARALHLRPDDPGALILRSRLRRMARDHRGALADAERAVELEPRFPFGLIARCRARLAMGDLDAALRDAEAALALDPANPLLRYERANVHYRRKDVPAAMRDLDAAIARGKGLGLDKPYVMRGLLRKRAGNLRGALADYGEAIRIAPHNATARYNRGYLLHTQGQHAEARADLERAVALQPKAAESWSVLARVRHATGDLAGAIRDMRRAQALRDYYGYHFWLARFYRAADRTEEARTSARRALASAPPSKHRAIRAWIARELGPG